MAQNRAFGTKNLKYTIFLTLMLPTTMMIDHVPVDHTEYIVKLGDPWKVSCETPYRDPTQWWFRSALYYFNHYLFWGGKIVVMIESRYKMLETYSPHIYTLVVHQTDMNHAGIYRCSHKDGIILDGSRYFLLTLVGKSNIELFLDKSNDSNLILQMKISYVGFRIDPPVFQCTFHDGNKFMDKKCRTDDLLTCDLHKLYGPDDDIPSSCRIFFERNNKILNDTKLSIMKNSIIQYVKKGERFNVSCNTASTLSMSWYFNAVQSSKNESLLFSLWTVHSEEKHGYDFTYSSDYKTYGMSIENVDVNHAGTYECTHKSTRNLIEKKIDLVIIDDSSINVLIKDKMLLMSITYIGPQIAPMPLFRCSSKTSQAPMKKRYCFVTEQGFTKCQINETYEESKDGHCRYQIVFEDHIILEDSPS